MSFKSTVSINVCTSYDDGQVAEVIARALTPFGGMGELVAPGERVLIKPNLLSARTPREAVTTHPAVVKHLVRACVGCGAASVWVADSPAGTVDDDFLWQTTGMAEAVREAGGELRSCRGPVMPWQCGKAVVPVPAWYADVDCLISVPKLKTHSLTGMTCALKNSYGLVSGKAKSTFHAEYPSPKAMSRFLTEVFSGLVPRFTFVDAVMGMEGDGPSGGKPVPLGLVLASTDPLALDVICCKVLGLAERDVPMLEYARTLGLGEGEFGKVQLAGNGVRQYADAHVTPSVARYWKYIPEAVFGFITRLFFCRLMIRAKRCTHCGICRDICSKGAVYFDERHHRFRIDRRQCMLCMCCAEACPNSAIVPRSLFHAAGRLRHWLRRARDRVGKRLSR